MAILLVRGIDGPGATPPPATGTRFTDVPANAFGAAHIERLAALGITSRLPGEPTALLPGPGSDEGADGARSCSGPRTGGTTSRPPPPARVFADVPASHPFAAWIEQLAREGITAGCGTNPARYCPEAPLTRGQIAVFLVRTFHLPL